MVCEDVCCCFVLAFMIDVVLFDAKSICQVPCSIR